MGDNAYRRNVAREDSYSSAPYGDQRRSEDYAGGNAYRQQHAHQRGHNPQQINLKMLKNTSLTCAKQLTNKLISLSNTGLQVASTAINSYKESAAANARKAAIANPNSFLRIAERISSTEDPIASHRELVAVIEHMLIWSNLPIQVNVERDRYGLPTPESLRSFRLINETLLKKVLVYVEGRRDCCVFIVKFVTWRIRTTNQPEEVILSLELLQTCVESFGGYFLALMTKSCMRRFRRLLRMTKLNNSIAGGVKKQLTKLLIGSTNVHPGVPTDMRIHVIKAKVLHMVQLWHDVFLLDQGLYPVFFEGYRELRARGFKFPQVDPAERSKINLAAVTPKPRFNMGSGLRLPLAPEELEGILNLVQTLDSLPPGPQRDAAIAKMRECKGRIVECVNILAEQRSQAVGAPQHEELLKKMLLLNDCVGAHLSLTAAGSQSSSVILSKLDELNRDARWQPAAPTAAAAGAVTVHSPARAQEADKANLLDLDSSSESDNNEEFDSFFGSARTGPSSKGNEDDYDKFFAEFGVIGTAPKATPSTASAARGRRKDYTSDLNSLDFGNPVSPNTASAPAGAAAGQEAAKPRPVGAREDAEEGAGAATAAGSATKEKKKSLSEMMEEFDNMEFDFGHMSVTGF